MNGRYQSIMETRGAATGYAVRSYADGAGAHRCDVFLTGGRGFFAGCYVLNGQSNKIGAPSEPWKEQLDPRKHPLVLCVFREAGLNPTVLGRLDQPEIAYVDASKRTQHNADVEHAPTQSTVQDVVVGNGGNRFRLLDKDAGGDAVLEPLRHFNVSLKDEGRVNIGGYDGFFDGPVLASRHVERDDEIRALLQAMVDFLQRLTTVSPTGTISTPPIPFLATGLSKLSADDIRSAVLSLSSRSQSGSATEPSTEGDEGT